MLLPSRAPRPVLSNAYVHSHGINRWDPIGQEHSTRTRIRREPNCAKMPKPFAAPSAQNILRARCKYVSATHTVHVYTYAPRHAPWLVLTKKTPAVQQPCSKLCTNLQQLWGKRTSPMMPLLPMLPSGAALSHRVLPCGLPPKWWSGPIYSPREDRSPEQPVRFRGSAGRGAPESASTLVSGSHVPCFGLVGSLSPDTQSCAGRQAQGRASSASSLVSSIQDVSCSGLVGSPELGT